MRQIAVIVSVGASMANRGDGETGQQYAPDRQLQSASPPAMQQRLCAAVALCAVAWSCGQQQATATAGVPSGGSVLKPFYAAEHKEMKDEHQDRTDRTVDVYYPTRPSALLGSEANRSFPLLAFAHGYSGGGPIENIAYGELLRGLAGFGFVVVAPRACDYYCECRKQCSLPGDPEGFQAFYRMQLRSLEWARGQVGQPGPFAELDLSPGAGIVGHRYGGRSTHVFAIQE
jgi:hypothetical protein